MSDTPYGVGDHVTFVPGLNDIYGKGVVAEVVGFEPAPVRCDGTWPVLRFTRTIEEGAEETRRTHPSHIGAVVEQKLLPAAETLAALAVLELLVGPDDLAGQASIDRIRSFITTSDDAVQAARAYVDRRIDVNWTHVFMDEAKLAEAEQERARLFSELVLALDRTQERHDGDKTFATRQAELRGRLDEIRGEATNGT